MLESLAGYIEYDGAAMFLVLYTHTHTQIRIMGLDMTSFSNISKDNN